MRFIQIFILISIFSISLAVCEDGPSSTGKTSLGRSTSADTGLSGKENFIGSSGTTRNILFDIGPKINYLKYVDKNNIFLKNDKINITIDVLKTNDEDKISLVRAVESVSQNVKYLNSIPSGKYDNNSLTWYQNIKTNYPNECDLRYEVLLNKSGNYAVSGATKLHVNVYSYNDQKEETLNYLIDPIYITVYNRAPEIINVDYPKNIWVDLGQEISATVWDEDDNISNVECKLFLDGAREIKLKNRILVTIGDRNFRKFFWVAPPNLERGTYNFRLIATDKEPYEISIGNPSRDFTIEEGFPINFWYVLEIIIGVLFIEFFTHRFNKSSINELIRQCIHFIK